METKKEPMAILCQKINDIAKKIGSLKPEGENKHSHYNYITYKQMDKAVREHGDKICILPECVDHVEENFTTNEGKVVIRTIVIMEFLIVDNETGFSIVRRWRGGDQDYGGKSFGQALTEAYKRFYFKLFKISDDDSEPDNKTVEIHKGEQKLPIPNDVIPFGKHKGKTYMQVPLDYLKWLRDQKQKDGDETGAIHTQKLMDEWEKQHPKVTEEQPKETDEFESPIDDGELPFEDKPA